MAEWTPSVAAARGSSGHFGCDGPQTAAACVVVPVSGVESACRLQAKYIYIFSNLGIHSAMRATFTIG